MALCRQHLRRLCRWVGRAGSMVLPLWILWPAPVATEGAAQAAVAEATPHYAGWATVAYPSMSTADMHAALARQAASGANIVWVGHDNPGEADATVAEPGLSYAVYAALHDPNNPRQRDAQDILAAQLRLLDAARELGVRVVLPIGYQLQMGTAWDDAHPDALRRDSDGQVSMETGVPNASLYAPALQADLQEYYAWVDTTLVRPYWTTIVMLNLADEPAGTDYSSWADAEFQRRTGYAFASIGDDRERQEALGRFQSNYIVDYASWAAAQWVALEPELPTTMSFCSAIARLHLELPQVEHLFARTPANFRPTFDAYPRDGPPEAAIDDATLVRLFTLVRSLGHYSARYGKPFWLWSTANSWGLGQASADPANVADAVANGYYLALLARQTGGLLEGIAVWNYNVRGQGLYQDTHSTTYDADTMFARVSESFPHLRALLAAPGGVTRVLIWAPNRYPYQALGASRLSSPWSFRGYDFDLLLALARNNVAAAVTTDLAGEDIEQVRSILVLARTPDDLADTERAQLSAFAAQGGLVVAGESLHGALGENAIYVTADRVEAAFTDSPSGEELALWRRALGVDQPIQAYYVASATTAVFYSIRADPCLLELRLAFPGTGYLAGLDGAPGQVLDSRADATASSVVMLGPHQYAYLTRASPSP
jgi:hypothetical protein